MNFKKDLLLLFLYIPGSSSSYNEPIKGRTRLVKALFLFRNELLSVFKKDLTVPDEELYSFMPWRFGPFSPEIYQDIDFFVSIGFIRSELVDGGFESDEERVEEFIEVGLTSELPEEIPFGRSVEQFSLTTIGQRFVAERLLDEMSKNQLDLLSEFKRGIVEAPLNSILAYVYSKYPSQTVNSEIKHKY